MEIFVIYERYSQIIIAAIAAVATLAAFGLSQLTKGKLSRSWLILFLSGVFFIVKEIIVILKPFPQEISEFIAKLFELFFVVTITIGIVRQYLLIKTIAGGSKPDLKEGGSPAQDQPK